MNQDRFQKRAEEKETLFQNITYGDLPEEARRIIFEAAWEAGHSAGPHEVEYFYNDYTEMIEKVLTVMGKVTTKYPNLLKPMREDEN